MLNQWYWAKGKQKCGPFTYEQLQQMASVGVLSPSDMVLNDGAQTWVSIKDVPGIAFAEALVPVATFAEPATDAVIPSPGDDDLAKIESLPNRKTFPALPASLGPPETVGEPLGEEVIVTFPCPRCRATLQVGEVLHPIRFLCPKCGQAIEVSPAPPRPGVAPIRILPVHGITPLIFPRSVKWASVIWVLNGSVIVLYSLVFLAVGSRFAGVEIAGTAACISVGACLCASVFIAAGIKTMRGTAPDTLGNGIGSIFFGFAPFTDRLVSQAGPTSCQFVEYIFGFALIAAGVLALVGRSDYKKWKDEQGYWR